MLFGQQVCGRWSRRGYPLRTRLVDFGVIAFAIITLWVGDPVRLITIVIMVRLRVITIVIMPLALCGPCRGVLNYKRDGLPPDALYVGRAMPGCSGS
jgi:hypothetical protein